MKKKKQITCAAGLQKRPGRSEKAPPHVLREQRSLAEAESLKRQLSFPSPLLLKPPHLTLCCKDKNNPPVSNFFLGEKYNSVLIVFTIYCNVQHVLHCDIKVHSVSGCGGRQ